MIWKNKSSTLIPELSFKGIFRTDSCGEWTGRINWLRQVMPNRVSIHNSWKKENAGYICLLWVCIETMKNFNKTNMETGKFSLLGLLPSYFVLVNYSFMACSNNMNKPFSWTNLLAPIWFHTYGVWIQASQRWETDLHQHHEDWLQGGRVHEMENVIFWGGMKPEIYC